jgi:branched-chain amino acid transport system permease protein
MLIIEQALNGIQLGVMLFLMAAGLTLLCGILNFLNLAHGSFYMLGAYFAVTIQALTGSFLVSLPLAVLLTAAVGLLVEFVALRTLYGRDHLDQVLCTFGLVLIFNDVVQMIWGPTPLRSALPAFLGGAVNVFGIHFPAIRLAIIIAGLAVALFLYVLISHTRIGMLIRAGASDRTMIGALGIDIALLFSLIFALGAGLAGFAGAMAAPLLSVQAGMGDPVLILALVVIVVGGVGSIRGAFVAAILIGTIDTVGRVSLPPALAEMSTYALMIVILLWRPRGLFSIYGR